MLRASRTAGFSEEELLATGLAQRSKTRPGSIYDRFRERVMFPAVDARGRVHGFGARAMRDNQRPKYLNTSDGELYHKREVLFGIDLARSAAARAGRMILVEGYTDVLALHQAGLVNAVGIMGTSLTEEQVTELERTVRVLELCLDADRAGQDAMLRAARLARARKLELRVVGLPDGTDPAELVEREGSETMRKLVQDSEPFVVFQVQRILERADTGSAEGRDRALDELRPVLRDMPPSIVRDELMRRVAGRLALTDSRLATLLAAGGSAGGTLTLSSQAPPAPGGAPAANGHGPDRDAPAAPPRDRGPRTERWFLALCIALPELGAQTLARLDHEAMLTSSQLRRAARHLADGHTSAPLAQLPPDDEEFARLMAELDQLARRVPTPSPERLEHARLMLDNDRIDRAILRLRGQAAFGAPSGTGGAPQSGDEAERDATGALAREREAVRAALRDVTARMESD